MVNSVYAKAYTEVLEIINHFPEEEYEKIPTEKIEFYKNNMDKNYQFVINPELDLEEQGISKEANAIIVTLFRDYFATEQQKEKLNILLNKNQEKQEEEKREKYNPDNLFKNRNAEEQPAESMNNLPMEVKKGNFFVRLVNFIKGIFKF